MSDGNEIGGEKAGLRYDNAACRLPYDRKDTDEPRKPQERRRTTTEYDAGADLRRLRTLGDGPVAPVAAAYNARGQRDHSETREGDGEEEMGVGRGDSGWVEPGLKGWLCVLGVSLTAS